MTQTLVFVGIDVSKAQLDVGMRPEGRFSVVNDEHGLAQLIEQLHTVTPTLVVLEATGGEPPQVRRGRIETLASRIAANCRA